LCAKLLLQVGDYFLHDGIDLLVVERLLVVLQRHAHGIRLLARLKVLALVNVDKSVQFSEVEKIAKDSDRKLLKEVSLFDVYEGKNLPAGKKSYAVSFFMQDESKTLNDKQIDAIMKKIQTNLEQKLGAQLR
jgi:hypothetical protein